MNSVYAQASDTISNSSRKLALGGMLAALAITAACSFDSARPVKLSPPASPAPHAAVRPAALQTVVPAEAHAASTSQSGPSAPRLPAARLLVYRSRDYGISFSYPWQYSILSARAIVNGGPSLQPRPDGHDGQFPLVRVQIPKGFYPDTDFASGYFMLTLNQDVTQQECESALGSETVETENIGELGYRWMETDSGGRGSASRVRSYFTFVNGTCYELEMGVKTSNQSGLAREVDPEQVMRRLQAILHTVKIVPELKDAPVIETSSAAPAPATRP